MNQNLLNITSIPISIEINVTNAQLKAPDKEPFQIDISRTPGGFKMQSRPAQIKIDTYEARSSMGYGQYNSGDFNRNEAQRGFKISYQGVASIVQDGNALSRGMSPAEIQAQQMRSGASIETIMDFLPKGGADVSFSEGTLNINYTPTDLSIDWDNVNQSAVEFVPGNIEFIIKEHPSVKIEYVGEPIYVPASANPNYKPPVLDTKG